MMAHRRALAVTFGAGWLALLVLRVAMNYAGSERRPAWQFLGVVGSVTAIWLLVIPVVCWIDRRRVERHASTVGWHVLAGLVVAMFEPWWTQQILATAGLARSYATLLVGRFDTNVLIYAIAVIADQAFLRFETFRARERHAARLQQSLADAQLQALALQLQPHFVFNTLQFVAETAHADLSVARRTLAQLRSLVKEAFALEQRLEVSLAEELTFLSAYGEIQKSRFGDRFNLTMDATGDVLGAAVPPLLLQPLVENAARHGFGRRAAGGRISVRARLDGRRVILTVTDDGDGLKPGMRVGQGLSVTRRRLERLHGASATLKLERHGEETVATLGIPYRQAPAATRVDVSPSPTSPMVVDGGESLSVGLRLAGFWCVLLALVAAGTAAAILLRPEAAAGFPIERIVADQVVGLPFWAMMTMAAIVMGRRASGVRLIIPHAVMAIWITYNHVHWGDDIRRALFGGGYPGESYLQWAVWDILVYAALVLITRWHDLHDWIAEKAREEVTLSAEVTTANTRLERLRETQSRLIAELDGAIAAPTMESLDRAVIGFAEFLRGEVMPDAVSHGGRPGA